MDSLLHQQFMWTDKTNRLLTFAVNQCQRGDRLHFSHYWPVDYDEVYLQLWWKFYVKLPLDLARATRFHSNRIDILGDLFEPEYRIVVPHVDYKTLRYGQFML